MLALPPLPPPILNEDRLDYDLDLCFEYLDLLASQARKSRDKSQILVKWRNCYTMMAICTMVFFNRKEDRRPVLVERARRRAVNTARYNKLHPIEVRLEAAILQSLKINEDQIAFREAIKKAHSEAMSSEGKLKEELKDKWKWKPEQQARIEPETETPSGNRKDNDKHADVFVELGFFLNHLALQLYPPPRYYQAVQDKTVGLTELILSSA
ncbi:hypothetical protein BGZ79_002242 [Entomortierella chlamydospora]|nr:hypothetical protein BGZ79_002242 [Entomortierella chlamydospora]